MSFQQEIDTAIKAKRLYFVGECLPPDWYAGFLLWLKMAEAGIPKAQYNVGRCYNRGEGIDQDSNLAKYWYLKAAEQNDPRAMFNLWLFFSDEKSPELNMELAKQYLDRALELGEARAVEFDQTQRDKAEKLAKEKEEAIKNQESAKNRQILLSLHKHYFETVENLLGKKQIQSVKSLAKEAADKNVMWMDNLLPFFDLEILSSKIEKDVKKETYAGGLYQGTTQYFTISKEFYRARIQVSNHSKIVLRGYLSSAFKVQPGERFEIVTDWYEKKKDEATHKIESIRTEDIIPHDVAQECKRKYFMIPLNKPIELKTGWFS